MSTNLCMKIRIPKEVTEEQFRRYFVRTPNRRGFCLPTKEYLDAFLDGDEDRRDWLSRFVVDVAEKWEVRGGKPVHSGYILTDSCRFNGGESLLNAKLLSRLFPDARIEYEQSIDGEFATLCVYEGGECVETKRLRADEERTPTEEA